MSGASDAIAELSVALAMANDQIEELERADLVQRYGEDLGDDSDPAPAEELAELAARAEARRRAAAAIDRCHARAGCGPRIANPIRSSGDA